MENLIIGAEGWLHESWHGDFYPEGLPEDWRLDFYSQQFKCVLVAEKQWLSWEKSQLEEIAESLAGESFTLVFKLIQNVTAENLNRLKNIIASLAGVSIRLLINPSQSAVKNLPKFFNDISITFVEDSATAKRGRYPFSFSEKWSWSVEDQVLYGDPLAYVTSLPENSKQQVQLLQSFAESLPKDQAKDLKGLEGIPFIISEKQVKTSQLIQLQTLAELLGF